MAKSQMSEFIQRLRSSVLLEEDMGLTDGRLLEEYLRCGDKAALAAIVREHGPMIWGVCCRLLPNYHDAEDAFQATFLVLVRKAASIASKELLANWLYGVAHQTSLKARATAARRYARERQVIVEMPDPFVVAQDQWHDLRPILDEELSRLPTKYRTVILLCDLEGKTRKEVARQLDLPEGTVASRMATARRMLAKRLTRHGLAVSGGALAALLTEKAAAGVPASVLFSTIQAVTLVVVGQATTKGVVSPRAAAISEGVLKPMLKVRIAAVGLLLVTLAITSLLPWMQASEPSMMAVEQEQKPSTAGGLKAKVEQKPVVVSQDAIVTRLVWSRDGRTVVTVSYANDVDEVKAKDENILNRFIPKNTIKVWNARTGELKQSLGEETNTLISALNMSPDGKTAAIASSDLVQQTSQVRLLDTEKWQQHGTIDMETDGMLGGVMGLDFAPDGKTLVIGRSGAKGSFVRSWDVQKKEWIQTKEDGKIDDEMMNRLCLSPEGKLFAVGDRKGKIRLISSDDLKLKHVLENHTVMISSLAFSPDSKTLVSTSFDDTVNFWNVETGKLLRTLEGSKGLSNAIAFTPDGKYLATAGGVNDNGKLTVKLCLWDAKTGKLEGEVPGLTLSVATLAFSPDGKTLAVGTGDLVDADTGKTKGELRLVPLESLLMK